MLKIEPVPTATGGGFVEVAFPYALFGATITATPLPPISPLAEISKFPAVGGATPATATDTQVGELTLPALPLAITGRFGVLLAAVTT